MSPHVRTVLQRAAALMVAALAGAAACTSTARQEPAPSPAPSETSRVETTVIEVGDQPYALDAAAGSVWVSGARSHLLEVRGRSVSSYHHPGGPLGIAVARGVVWTTAASGEEARVSQVIGYGAGSGRVEERISLRGESPYGIDADSRGIYVALHDGALVRIDPRTRAMTRVELGDRLTQVLVAHGFVWVSQPSGGVVWRVALDRGEPQATALSFRHPRRKTCPQGTGATGAAVLVADPCAGTVWVVDPRSGDAEGELADVGVRPVDVAAGGGLIYVVSMRDDKVTVLDAATLEAVAEATAGDGAISVVVGSSAAWVANSEDYSITKVEVRGPR
ncbi:MAG TPA: hypothetical protein VG318_12325 [Actinomycetota bacterium]|nr:hypothetical protein [Actinomycetota bacterium]